MHMNEQEETREDFNGKMQKNHEEVRKRMNKMKKFEENQWTITKHTIESCKHEGNLQNQCA